MITDAVLEQGIVRGIVTNEQVTSLRSLARDMAAAAAPEPEDDEKLRFVTGFSDIFVTLGLGLFLGALGYFVKEASGLAAMWLGLAVSAWLLAEFFTRHRRMALPSIVLLVVFAVSVFGAANHLLIQQTAEYIPALFRFLGLPKDRPAMIALTALITCSVVAVHYIRFRIPITIAAGTAALAGTMLALLMAVAPDFAKAQIRTIIFILGIAVFALAMRFDLSDPERVTRRNDIAFWLHLLAAPLIVHPVISQFVGDQLLSQIWTAVAVLAIFVLLGAVAVIIDRRAILVSGLAYAGYAFASIIRQIGLEDQTAPATLLALGAFVLLLSAGWRPVRTALLRLLPAHLAQRLPHPILSAS
ncbi:hypothetical protein MHY87_07535 [Microvirga sp. ACRRW]|uniref:hypothetical protein n=1 Tax=Microvirga sp. ACRRW TaxID=2918205 RepID=UPI001EF5E374|nr:hypothetical protein [Microvirga sp. ACRRW]MCG7392753.1 hypothetical protein [Microvirga sp. ACRRW]